MNIVGYPPMFFSLLYSIVLHHQNCHVCSLCIKGFRKEAKNCLHHIVASQWPSTLSHVQFPNFHPNIFYFSFFDHFFSFKKLLSNTMLVYKSGEDQCGSQVNNFIVVSKSHNTYQHSWYSHPPFHFTLMTEY